MFECILCVLSLCFGLCLRTMCLRLPQIVFDDLHGAIWRQWKYEEGAQARELCAMRMCIVSFFRCTVHCALHCALCHSSNALCIVLVAVHCVTLWMQYQLAAGASTHADVAAMHDGIVHLIEWRNLKRDGFALSIFYLDSSGTVDDTMPRMQQIVSTQTAHACRAVVGWLVHPFIKGALLTRPTQRA